MTTQEIAEKNLIYKVLVGSHAYGTNLPTSDKDYAGVFIPPIEYYFGVQAFDLLNEQKENDKAYYSLRKFVHLALQNNPNVLEILFVDDSKLLKYEPSFELIKEYRDKFLSQRCLKTYMGYAQAQLYRIKNHRKWLTQELATMEVLRPLVKHCAINRKWVQWRFGSNMVARLELELPALEKDWSCLVQQSWEEDTISPGMDICLDRLAGTGLVQPDENDPQFYRNYGQTADGKCTKIVFDEMKFKEAKKHRGQYTTWMAERDPSRHETELKYGYDTKHAMHLVRLLRTGYEILTTGQLIVQRPDASELLEIRGGKWTYEQLIAYADEMIAKVEGLTTFAVPEEPDTKYIDQNVVRATMDFFDMAISG